MTKEAKKEVKRVRKMVGRLYTKAPKIIIPKKSYKRRMKYQVDWRDED